MFFNVFLKNTVKIKNTVKFSFDITAVNRVLKFFKIECNTQYNCFIAVMSKLNFKKLLLQSSMSHDPPRNHSKTLIWYC